MAFELFDKIKSTLSTLFEMTDNVITSTSEFGWIGDVSGFDQLNYFHTPQITKSGNQINGKQALAISAFFDGVRMIAEDIAKLKLDIFTTDPQGNKIKVNKKHNLFRIISMSPDGVHTSQQFWETMFVHALVWGNGYAIIDKSGSNGFIRSLQLIHPNRVSIEKENGIVTYLIASDSTNDKKGVQQPQRFRSDQIFRLRGIGDLDSPWPIANFARESLGITLATQTLQSNMFSNGLNLGGTLQTEQVLGKEHREGMADEWQAKYGGVNNFGKTAVIDAGLKYTPNTSLKAGDSELLATRKFQVEEIARWLRIPLHKLGILESNATFNNIEQENLKYITETLGAWMMRNKNEIEMKLLRFNTKFFVEYDIKPLTMADGQSRSNFWKTAIETGAATPNDAAADLGFATYPEGNLHYISNNVQSTLAVDPSDDGVESEAAQTALDFATLKAKFDSYGVGVRSGAITPQTVDEDSFRKEADLPVMGQEVKDAWELDGGVRRPITLKSQDDFESTSEANIKAAGNTDTETETETTETEESEQRETIVEQLDPHSDLFGRYQKLMIRPLQECVVNREVKYNQNIDRDKQKFGDKWKFDKARDNKFYSEQHDFLKETLNPFLQDLQIPMPKDFVLKWVGYKQQDWQTEKAFLIANDLIKHYLQAQNLPEGLYAFGDNFLKIDKCGVVDEIANN